MDTDMGKNLIELLDKVHDEESFLVFVEALIADRVEEIEEEKIKPTSPYGTGVNNWQNTKVENFLEGAVAWARSARFGRVNLLNQKFDENYWNQFAHFLYAGKIYE